MTEPNPINEPTGNTVSRIEQTYEIFSQVAEVPVSQQETLLKKLCPDEQLQQRIREMLSANSVDDPLLDQPLVPEPVDIQEDDEIDNFKLIHELGRGGMGVVFLADQLEPIRRKVALKVIKPGVDTKEVIARFEAERHALSLMDHPNIAKVLDAGTTIRQRPFFVMELVNGQPITSYCEQNDLSIQERLRLFIPVCRAIQHAHQKGIIHRDIKPSNVLVAEYDGQPLAKVIDFGVAKATDQSLSKWTLATGLGQIIGSFDYMSPEQSRVGQRDIDTRSDIYSLGVLLYELLTGRPPFDRDRLRSVEWEEMLRIVREEDPPKPSARLTELTKIESKSVQIERARLIRAIQGELDWIVLKAIEKDPNRRYETPNEFADDIDRFLNGDAVSACPPSRLYRFRKLARRNKVAIVTSAIVAASLIVGIIGTSWQASRASRAEHAFRQASEFFAQDLVVLAGPEAELSTQLKPDPNLQLLIFLNHLLDRVDYRFENQPQVKANLKASLSHSFNILGRHEDASRLCREYLEFLSETKGPDHPDSIRVARQLIRFYLDESRIADAEQLIHPTLKRSQQVLGDKNEVTLKICTDLATLYHEQDKFDLARDTHLKCLKTKREVFGEVHMETLQSKSKLATVFESLQKFDDAEALHFQVLRANQNDAGSHKNMRVAASMNNLARCYVNRGVAEDDNRRFVEAEKLLKDGLQLYPDTLEIKRNLARTYLELGEFEEAEPLLVELEERLSTLLGSTDPTTLEARNMLGVCYLKENRLSDSEYFLASAFNNLRQHFPNSPQMLQSMKNLAIVYRAMGKLELSIDLDEAALEQLDQNDPATLPTLARLGMNYLDVGRTAEGRAKLKIVYKSGRDVTGIYTIAAMLADNYLSEEIEAAVHQSDFDFQNTRYWTQQQLESSKQQMDKRAFANVLIQCSQRQLRMKDFVAAETNLRESIKILESFHDSLPSLQAQALMGEALAGQQRYYWAKQVLRAAFEKMIKLEIQSKNRPLVLKVIEELITINLIQDNEENVNTWRRQKAEIALANST